MSRWRFNHVAPVPVRGRFWRMLSPRWAALPLSGDGAARRGGRWNAAGQPALYLSATHATAIAEYMQDLVRPGTLAPYDVNAARVLDLANADVRAALGVNEALLSLGWRRIRDVERARPATWDLADAALAAGFGGLRVPSARADGFNVVLWRWNAPGEADVRCLDPADDLPRDQASWQ